MKKALAIAGLAALIAGVSCSSEIKGRPAINENASMADVCDIGSMGYCSVNQFMYADSDSVTELTPETFDSFVSNSELPVVTKFYAEWCGPCRTFKPVFEKVCAEYEGKLNCGAYNVDQDREIENGLSDRYGVDRIPTTGFFCNGESNKERWFIGGKPENVLRRIFDEFLKECGE